MTFNYESAWHEVAAQAWKAWSKVCPTMVAVIDRDTWDQVEPYGYG